MFIETKQRTKIVVRKNGLCRLYALTGGELRLFLCILKHAKYSEEKEVSVDLLKCHKQAIAKELGFSSTGSIDNGLQKLVKRGLIKRKCYAFYVFDKEIVYGLE